MKKFVLVVLLICLFQYVSAKNWDIVNQVKILENIYPDYANDADSDLKFIKVLNLIDDSAANDEERITELNRLLDAGKGEYSKYYDSFLYWGMAKLYSNKKHSNLVPKFYEKLRNKSNESIHLFAAWFIHCNYMKDISKTPLDKNSISNFLREIRDWTASKTIHGPYFSGSIVFGYAPMADFTQNKIKIYSIQRYKLTIIPLEGFRQEETYIELLNEVYSIDEIWVKEAILLNLSIGNKEAASKNYYDLGMIKKQSRLYIEAKECFEKSVEYSPNFANASKELKKVLLELEMNTEQKIQAVPQKVETETISPTDKPIQISDLKGKSLAETRLFRNEIFARYGRPFNSIDLQEYFSKKSWYKINPDYNDDLLTPIDKQNINTILEYENLLKSTK